MVCSLCKQPGHNKTSCRNITNNVALQVPPNTSSTPLPAQQIDQPPPISIPASVQKLQCPDEKCGRAFSQPHLWFRHVAEHANPETRYLIKEAKKQRGGEKKEIELYCEFPTCEKRKGGEKETIYHSLQGYSNHTKSHIDPETNRPWLPNRKPISTVTQRAHLPLTEIQQAKRNRKMARWKRGLQRRLRERLGVNLEGGRLFIPGGKELRDDTLFPEMFPENEKREKSNVMIHSIKNPDEYMAHFTRESGGKIYPMQYGRVFRRTWVNFPLYITYDLETRLANVEGTYTVIEEKNVIKRK